MRGDFRAALDQRGRSVRVWQADGNIVEALEIVLAIQFGGLDLQGARLEADAGGRHGDAILLGQIVQRLHLFTVAQQIVRQRAQRGDRLDVLPTMGAVPDGEHWRHAGRYHVDGAGQQRFVHRSGAGDGAPLDLHLVQPLGLGVLLDQLLILDHVQHQVTDAELLGDADLAFGLRGQRCCQCAEQAQRGGQTAECEGVGHGRFSLCDQ